MPLAEQKTEIGPATTEVRKVQLALDDLWTRAHVESRAYTGNLVAITEKKHVSRVEEALDGVAGRHAGRQIVGVVDGEETVTVRVSLVPQGEVYVERLVLDANAEQLRGAILPLLRPATKNHVWWAADAPPSGDLLHELAELADQVIADTLRLDLGPLGARCALADLGWARTSTWREATALLFDAPDAAARLPHLKRARVLYAGGNDRPARLFGGWLGSKLGFGDPANVLVEPDPDSARENGDLSGVELLGGDAVFRLWAGPGDAVRCESRFGNVDRVAEVLLRTPGLSEGLGLIMDQPQQNDNFLDALAFAKRLHAEGST